MIYDFLKNPNIEFKQNRSFNHSLKDLFRVLLYSFLFLFINYLVVSSIDFIIRLNTGFSFIGAINRVQQEASDEKNILFFLLFAPVIEELIFRLPLKIKRLNIFISLTLAYYLFYLSHKNLTSLIVTAELIKYFIFCLIIAVLVFKLYNRFFVSVSTRYYKIYFYVVTSIFGLLHVTNFIVLVPENLVFLSPIFAFHQVIVGFFLGYLRLKRGMWWCILLHFLLNLLPAISYFINK